MRLRTVGADRLALALAQPEMVDDPGAENEHDQRAGDHRAAGAEGDVAKHIEERTEDTETRHRVGKINQPVEHSIRPIPRLRRERSCGESDFRARGQWSSSSSPAIP